MQRKQIKGIYIKSLGHYKSQLQYYALVSYHHNSRAKKKTVELSTTKVAQDNPIKFRPQYNYYPPKWFVLVIVPCKQNRASQINSSYCYNYRYNHSRPRNTPSRLCHVPVFFPANAKMVRAKTKYDTG